MKITDEIKVVAWRWKFDVGAGWSYGDSRPARFRFGDPDFSEPLCRYDEAKAEIARLRQENEALRKALEPFAKLIQHYADYTPDDEFAECVVPYVGDLRRAAEALASHPRQSSPVVSQDEADDLTAAYMAGFERGKDAGR